MEVVRPVSAQGRIALRRYFESDSWMLLDAAPFVLPCRQGYGRAFRSSVFRRALGSRERHIEELIALAGDYRVARAAFDEAVKRRPGRTVTLMQRTGLLADSREKNEGAVADCHLDPSSWQ